MPRGAVLAFLLFVSDLTGEPLSRWQKGELDIHHISTGRGNATLLVLPDGTTLLVDAGASKSTDVSCRLDGSSDSERAKDQIVLRYDLAAYPSFEIRNLTANGEHWTGVGDESRSRFPPRESLAREDFPSENMCSLSFRLRYGAFDYYTGGDLSGIPNVGHPDWQNMEQAIASAVGAVDVHVVNHHGSIDPASPTFLAALQPRVHIIPSWSATHPAPSVLKRLLSERAYPGPREVFALELREPTRAAIGPRAEQVLSDSGHVVVRVERGGARYRVLVVTSTEESGEVRSTHGPYDSR